MSDLVERATPITDRLLETEAARRAYLGGPLGDGGSRVGVAWFAAAVRVIREMELRGDDPLVGIRDALLLADLEINAAYRRLVDAAMAQQYRQMPSGPNGGATSIPAPRP